jgi:hypothetical protein
MSLDGPTILSAPSESAPVAAKVPAFRPPAPPDLSPPPAPAHLREVLRLLRSAPDPLYAVLDAARDWKVKPLVEEFPAGDVRCLFSGESATELAGQAPYLVRLPADCPQLEPLVLDGWGDSWGVFLTCREPAEEVRAHLRKFLMVELEGQGPDGGPAEAYFRFYDPRVMRAFLPTCNEAETAEFFGPVRAWLLEGRKPDTLLRFTGGKSGVRKTTVPLPTG